MQVDHVIPKALGGPDSYFNYVLTSKYPNSMKLDKLDPVAAFGVLSFIRIYSVPIIEDYLTSFKKRRISLETRVNGNGTANAIPVSKANPYVAPQAKFSRLQLKSNFNSRPELRAALLAFHALVNSNPAIVSSRGLINLPFSKLNELLGPSYITTLSDLVKLLRVTSIQTSADGINFYEIGQWGIVETYHTYEKGNFHEGIAEGGVGIRFHANFIKLMVNTNSIEWANMVNAGVIPYLE
jgi:hypothetical protein